VICFELQCSEALQTAHTTISSYTIDGVPYWMRYVFTTCMSSSRPTPQARQWYCAREAVSPMARGIPQQGLGLLLRSTRSQSSSALARSKNLLGV